jgi:hypothetical protein
VRSSLLGEQKPRALLRSFARLVTGFAAIQRALQ